MRCARHAASILIFRLERLIDVIVRVVEREAWLRAMNGGNIGWTLRDAARAGGLLDVRFLLSAGADAGADDGWVLCYACRGGHIQVAVALLNAGGTLTPHHRNVALCHAGYLGHTACCKLLLDRAEDIHFQDADPEEMALRAKYASLYDLM